MKIKKPNLLFAYIGIFLGYPLLIVGSILGIFFTFGLSMTLLVYLDVIRFSILYGICFIFAVTIPTTYYYLKGNNLNEEKYLLIKWIGIAISFIILFFVLLGKMNWIAPELCKEIYNSNVTITGGEYC